MFVQTSYLGSLTMVSNDSNGVVRNTLVLSELEDIDYRIFESEENSMVFEITNRT